MRRWLWVGEQLYSAQDADALLADATRCHFTDLVVQMHRYNGVAINSDMYTMTPDRFGGQLPIHYIADHAHDLGIRVHVWWIIGTFEEWVSTWPHWIAGVPDEWNTINLPDCDQENLNFSLLAVRQALADATADICTNNPTLDGLDIDYVRYEPGMVQSVAGLNASDIDLAVQHIYDTTTLPLMMSGVPPYIPGDYVGGWDTLGCGQDWPRWVDEGLVQTVKAMNYCWPNTLDAYITEHYDNVLTDAVKARAINGVMPFGYAEDPMSPAQWEQVLDIVAQHVYELAVFDNYLLNQNDAYKQALADRPLSNDGETTMSTVGDLQVIIAGLQEQIASIEQIITDLQAYDADADALAAQAQVLADTIED